MVRERRQRGTQGRDAEGMIGPIGGRRPRGRARITAINGSPGLLLPACRPPPAPPGAAWRLAGARGSARARPGRHASFDCRVAHIAPRAVPPDTPGPPPCPPHRAPRRTRVGGGRQRVHRRGRLRQAALRQPRHQQGLRLGAVALLGGVVLVGSHRERGGARALRVRGGEREVRFQRDTSAEQTCKTHMEARPQTILMLGPARRAFARESERGSSQGVHNRAVSAPAPCPSGAPGRSQTAAALMRAARGGHCVPVAASAARCRSPPAVCPVLLQAANRSLTGRAVAPPPLHSQVVQALYIRGCAVQGLTQHAGNCSPACRSIAPLAVTLRPPPAAPAAAARMRRCSPPSPLPASLP